MHAYRSVPELFDLQAGGPLVRIPHQLDVPFTPRVRSLVDTAEFQRLRLAAARARERGLTVNAGHGISYVNIAEVRTLPHLHELNIGHSILSRALFTGIVESVREMKRLMNP